MVVQTVMHYDGSESNHGNEYVKQYGNNEVIRDV